MSDEGWHPLDLVVEQKKRIAELEAAMREIKARTYSNDRGCELQADAVAEICDIAAAALKS